jgi:phosphoglycolate phosphatase-like HAD superfamily hydrolase
MVGDSTLDIQMAINAKMPNIAITTGVHTKEQLYNSNADFVVDDLSSILDLLNLK